MSDESYSFTAARARLEEIVSDVRKKDTSLEKSLDLLEEGVRLANICTELIDHADWTPAERAAEAEAAGVAVAAGESVEADALEAEGAQDAAAESEAADGSPDEPVDVEDEDASE